MKTRQQKRTSREKAERAIRARARKIRRARGYAYLAVAAERALVGWASSTAMSVGWQCPACFAIHAPSVLRCDCLVQNFRISFTPTESPCAHDACPTCRGTGVGFGGTACTHSLVCYCPKCSPSCEVQP